MRISESTQPLREFSFSDEQHTFLDKISIANELQESAADFYLGFKDKSEQVQQYDVLLSPPFKYLRLIDSDFVEHCLEERLSQSSSENMFGLLQICQTEFEEKAFKSGTVFASYVHLSRQELVCEQGWLDAVIHTTIGANRSGLFRDITGGLRKVLNNAGEGLICEPTKEFIDGERCFSHPMNSKEAEELHR